MNDIQEAFEKWYITYEIPIPLLMMDNPVIYGMMVDSYQAGIDSLKCCGCCKWIKWRSDFETYYCASPTREPGNQRIEHVHDGPDCHEWELRSKE